VLPLGFAFAGFRPEAAIGEVCDGLRSRSGATLCRERMTR
jgi:hypothetical protein